VDCSVNNLLKGIGHRVKFLQNIFGVNYGTISAFRKILTNITTDSSAVILKKVVED